MGQIQTFINPNPLEAISGKDGEVFLLNPNTSYQIWVHDPNYFILSGRPLIFPGIMKKYQVKSFLYSKIYFWLNVKSSFNLEYR